MLTFFQRGLKKADKVRLIMKRKSGHNIDNDEVACSLVGNVSVNGCTPENLDGILRKIKNAWELI